MRNLVFVAVALATASSTIAASAASNERTRTARPVVSTKTQTAESTTLAAALRQWKESNVGQQEKAPKKAVKTAAAKSKATTRKSTARKSASRKTAKRKQPRIVARSVIKQTSRTGYPAGKRVSVTIDTKTKTVGSLAAFAPTANPAPASAVAYQQIVSKYATAYGVPANLAHAVISVESNYRVDALGSAGEVGLMQIKPATARMMGYGGSTRGLFDPETNIRFGMKYLAMAHKLGGGATCGTILRYNAGHAATRMNPISSAYCAKVQQRLAGL